MPRRLTKLRITKIALVPQGANQEAHVLLYKSAVPPAAEEEDVETVTKAVHDAVLAELETLKKANAALTEQVATLKPSDPDDIWKGVNPALKKMYEEQQERTRKAEEAIAVEKAEREKVVFIAKARGFQYLPINPDDDWEVFKGLATLPEKVQTRLDALFKSAEELGRLAKIDQRRGRDGSDGGGSPLQQLEAIAREYVAKGLEKTEADGMTRATREHPDLYRQYARGVQKEERD